jgi:transposase InsO family protein
MANKRLTLEEKAKLVQELELGRESVSALCRGWRISRQSAYKWWRRHQAAGIEGLREASRAPRRQPRKLTAKWSERIAAVRASHPRWGAKKLRVQLRREHPRVKLPAVSTIGAELRRSGQARGRARRAAGPEVLWEPKLRARCANDVWTVDFKGWFRTGDGRRCEPLTVRDLASRFGLCAQVLGGTRLGPVQARFVKVFRRYGLPRVIRCDQGVPFAGSGPALLARLSAWWVSLGIRVEFSRRARPGDNAAHEQWHREMKAEAANPPAATVQAQQRRQDRWLRQYNQERPHEALGQRVPAAVYRSSPRRYEGSRPADYGGQRRRVRPGGEIRWQGRRRFVGESFEGFCVGLRKASPGVWRVYFYKILIGELHDSDRMGLRSARYRRPPQ